MDDGKWLNAKREFSWAADALTEAAQEVRRLRGLEATASRDERIRLQDELAPALKLVRESQIAFITPNDALLKALGLEPPPRPDWPEPEF
jgi:hypothetical protein